MPNANSTADRAKETIDEAATAAKKGVNEAAAEAERQEDHSTGPTRAGKMFFKAAENFGTGLAFGLGFSVAAAATVYTYNKFFGDAEVGDRAGEAVNEIVSAFAG